METYQTTKKIININTRKEIRKHISQQTKTRSREYGTITNQKRHIKSLLEHKTFLEPITYTRNPNTNQIITEPTEMKESLLKNYQRVHATRPPANLETLPFLINIQEIYDPNPDIDSNWYDLVTQPIDIDELKQIIKNLPTGKAPGITGENYETYKILADYQEADSSMNIMLALINNTLETGHIANTDKTGRIILLPKDDEWLGSMSRLRPITLLEPYRKILEAIIQTRLQKTMNKHKLMDDLNFGFKKGYSTNEAITMIQVLVDIANSKTKHKTELSAAALDVSAAFDTVPFSAP